MMMVERVARAIFNADQRVLPAHVRRKPFDDLDESSGVALRYRNLARAAIAAMREPTKPMCAAASASMSPEKRPTLKRVGVKAKHAIRYRAMIDAALSDE